MRDVGATVGDWIPLFNDAVHKTIFELACIAKSERRRIVLLESSNDRQAQSLVRHGHGHPRKRRRIDRRESSVSLPDKTSADAPSLPLKRRESDDANENVDLETVEVKNGESIAALRKMVLGKVEYQAGSQTAPGKYLALDCEMVGVGIDGDESSLARVSIVNYAGAIILDVFVRQRERVVDYRTQWSGVRSTDLGNVAKPFKEVQQLVAELIKDRILVGHAIYNDLRALLLSHPSPQIRDTQSLAYKHRVVKSRRPALRVLVKQELGIVIQGGEHSSVTDARATMAVFRLHRKQWESGFRSFRTPAQLPTRSSVDDGPADKPVSQSSPSSRPLDTRGRKRRHSEDDEAASIVSRAQTQHPSPSKRQKPKADLRPSAGSTRQEGISSGISTVVRRASGTKEVWRKGMRTRNASVGDGDVRNSSKGGKQRDRAGDQWWKSLGGDKKGSSKL